MNLDDIYYLGSHMDYIWFAETTLPRVKVEEKSPRLLGILKQIRDIVIKEKIGVNSIPSISKWITKLEKEYQVDTKIKKEDAEKLANDSLIWHKEIVRNLKLKPVLEIKLQSGLNPVELNKVAQKAPNQFIPSSVWRKMTPIERSDLSDAAKCLLLGTATPSVMVALRGAEACLRNFYQKKTNEDPGKKTWRQLTTALKANIVNLHIEDTFVGYLEYIGDAKRNFAQHPNKIYSLREAVIIFMQIVSLIEDTYSKL